MSKRRDIADLASELRSVPRLAGLSEAELKTLAAAGTKIHLPADWTLMSETTPSDKAYVILEGQVAIRKHGTTVATVGAGDVIGEVGVMEHRLRTASVVSTTELQVVHFTQDHFAELVASVPAFAAAMHATAEEHLGHSPEPTSEGAAG